MGTGIRATVPKANYDNILSIDNMDGYLIVNVWILDTTRIDT